MADIRGDERWCGTAVWVFTCDDWQVDIVGPARQRRVTGGSRSGRTLLRMGGWR